jgi:hypothetical protein
VTFNGKSFDFPYINIRSAILGIPVPRTFSRHPDFQRIAILMSAEVLTNFNPYKKGTLEFFCEILVCRLQRTASAEARLGSFTRPESWTTLPATVLQTARRPGSCI